MSLPSGVPAPLFSALSKVNPKFAFGSLGGRFVLLLFLPPPSPEREAVLAEVRANSELIRDDRAMVFGVLADMESYERARDGEGNMRWFADPEGEIRRLYGAATPDGGLSPEWTLVDPSLRTLSSGRFDRLSWAFAAIRATGDPDLHAGAPLMAPVLVVPRVLEPDFCRKLIGLYEAQGGEPTGVMRAENGRTFGALDDFKRRRDTLIPEGPLQEGLRARLASRLAPEIAKAFQFHATRVERFIVACYDAEEGGYFLPHRDNTTPGTAHRRFAVSINLNAEEFEGGDLRFPEFGRRTYRPPTGGAVVFSCSLLHEATPVTKGRRYATLPFLYDEAAAKVREENLASLVVTPSSAAE